MMFSFVAVGDRAMSRTPGRSHDNNRAMAKVVVTDELGSVKTTSHGRAHKDAIACVAPAHRRNSICRIMG
jgi:hypothetical protein